MTLYYSNKKGTTLQITLFTYFILFMDYICYKYMYLAGTIESHYICKRQKKLVLIH